jgi:hypothetical protein
MTVEEKANQDLSRYGNDDKVVIHLGLTKGRPDVMVGRRGGITVADLRRKSEKCGGFVQFAIDRHNSTVYSPQLAAEDIGEITFEEYY